jgi:hypothetical protein
MYIKLKNGAVEKYPYSIGELRQDNPQVSFPDTLSDATLNEFQVFKVQQIPMPVTSDANVVEGNPVLDGGVWKQSWQVIPFSTAERLYAVQVARAKAYPPISDYLDGIIKGDTAQVQKYINDCLAVKAKFPKP